MKQYTHRDKEGMYWRFEGNRPISALADKIMEDVKKLKILPKSKRTLKVKKKKK